ncbi:hypothetical protein J6590_022654 [Homalodisca vitripennis]|nr:hypothetical protein J6590_022654 [Homalodisca vitripennis]
MLIGLRTEAAADYAYPASRLQVSRSGRHLLTPQAASAAPIATCSAGTFHFLSAGHGSSDSQGYFSSVLFRPQITCRIDQCRKRNRRKFT